MPVFVASDVGILGSMRRKLQARFVCAQLLQDGLLSSHYFLVRIIRIMCCFDIAKPMIDASILRYKWRIKTYLDMSLLALHTPITRFAMKSSRISIQSSIRHCIGSDFRIDCTKRVFLSHGCTPDEAIRSTPQKFHGVESTLCSR